MTPAAAVEVDASPLDAARAAANERAGTPWERARRVIDAFETGIARRSVGRAGGVFYTPDAIVRAMLDRVSLDGRILDPACGAGAFVCAIVDRLGPSVLERLYASDVDAQALEACTLALGAMLGEEHLDAVARWRSRHALRLDFLKEEWPYEPPDLVVGNPPYGLSDDPALEGRFPSLAGERDLFACFLLRALEVVEAHGRTALLVPDTWLSKTNSKGLRGALCGRGLERIVDFGKPFAAARDTRVHAVVVGRGDRCVVESLREGRLAPMATVTRDELRRSAAQGWSLYRTADEQRACAAMVRGGVALSSQFDVVYGLRTGDNARFVVDGPGPVPLVSGGDLEPYDRLRKDRHLAGRAEDFSQTRSQLGTWKVGVQRIRSNAKAPWRRWVEAALLGPDEVGLDSMTVLVPLRPVAEAGDPLHALMGVLNSSILNRFYKLAYTDVNVKPAYLRTLPVPRTSTELAAAVQRRLARPGDHALERAIDRLVADAYGLADEEVQVLERGYWGDRDEPLPTREEALRLAAG